MKRRSKLIDNQAGVIHHLGLIVFAAVLLGVIAFAAYRIQGQEVNYGYDSSQTDSEDQTQADLETAADESEQASNDAEEDLAQVTSLSEEEDEN